MSKFSPYPRRAYAGLFREWARRNVKTLSAFVGVFLALMAFATAVLLLLFPAGPLQWWLLGAIQVLLVALAWHFVNLAFLAHSREAIWQLRGAWGEEFTRDELRRAKRRRAV